MSAPKMLHITSFCRGPMCGMRWRGWGDFIPKGQLTVCYVHLHMRGQYFMFNRRTQSTHTAILPRQMRSALRGCAAPQPLYRSELTFDIGNPISSHAKQNLIWHRFCICTEEMTLFLCKAVASSHPDWFSHAGDPRGSALRSPTQVGRCISRRQRVLLALCRCATRQR